MDYNKLGKKVLEVVLKDMVTLGYDDLAAALKEEIKKAIPGQVDDAIVDMIAPMLMPAIKTVLLAQIDKISEEV